MKITAIILFALPLSVSAQLTITEAWYDQNYNGTGVSRLHWKGTGCTPGEHVYPREEANFHINYGRKTCEADGTVKTTRNDKPAPCSIFLHQPHSGNLSSQPLTVDRPEQPLENGLAIHPSCMPAEDWVVLQAEEYAVILGNPVLALNLPEEWCRWDSGGKRQYWPRPASGSCAPPVEQQDIQEALDAAILDGVTQGCLVNLSPVVFTVEMTADKIAATGGAISPSHGSGHILIHSGKVAESRDARYGTTLHEYMHAGIQHQFFPTALIETWGETTTWPEATAMYFMLRNMPGSTYYLSAHAPYPTTWNSGLLSLGPKAKRQAGLFYASLESTDAFNVCDFMGNQHALLIAGDEEEALRAHIPHIERRWTWFVAAYNQRRNRVHESAIPSIGLLPPAGTLPMASSATLNPMVANGLTEGETRQFTLEDLASLSPSSQASERCSPSPACWIIDADSGIPISTWVRCDTGEYNAHGSNLWHPGNYTATCASLKGDCHMRELTLTTRAIPYIPSDPWPPQDTNDPWAGSCP